MVIVMIVIIMITNENGGYGGFDVNKLCWW